MEDSTKEIKTLTAEVSPSYPSSLGTQGSSHHGSRAVLCPGWPICVGLWCLHPAVSWSPSWPGFSFGPAGGAGRVQRPRLGLPCLGGQSPIWPLLVDTIPRPSPPAVARWAWAQRDQLSARCSSSSNIRVHRKARGVSWAGAFTTVLPVSSTAQAVWRSFSRPKEFASNTYLEFDLYGRSLH